MAKLDDNGKRDLIEALRLTHRRIDQLIDLGVLVAGGDEKFDVERNIERYRAYKDRDFDYVERELKQATYALEDGLRLLRSEKNVQKRRELQERHKIGANIGRLDGAFRLGNALASEGQRPLLSQHTSRTVGDAINELFSLLGMEIDASAASG
jgi:hypothetical protein